MVKVNENRPVAIQVSGVKKMYRLGQIGGGTLQADLQSWWARVRGKEDPNTKIGEGERIKGQTFMALNGVDLTIYQGEAVGIIGGNGAGKSTLLKLLSKVTAPTEGEIDIYGRIASMLEVGTGFNGELTGRENVYMNGAILGMTKQEIDAKMEQIIDFSEVREFIDTPVKRYSSGMFVKLAFSVAAHLDSEIMIMDEVLAVGDMAFQKKCLDKMREAAQQEGRTVLYVSHNMNTIRQLCDRCIVLDKGKIIYEGDVEVSIQRYLGSKFKSDTFVELTDIVRDPEFNPHPITMNSIEILNGKSSVFSLGSKMHIRVIYSSEREIIDTFIRIIIKTSEGVPVTMTTVNRGFKTNSGERNIIECQLDISHIVPGRYTISPLVYEVNEFGGNNYLDGVKDAYCFEISTVNRFNNNMIWQPRYWGYFYGEPIELRVK